MKGLEQIALDLEELAAEVAARQLDDLASSLWMAAVAARMEWISSGDRRARLTPNLDAIMASASKCGDLPAVKLAGAAIAAAEGG